jgi:hypothetical protein
MGMGEVTEEMRKLLIDALARLAMHRPVEHRAYGAGIAEARRRLVDTAWASGQDREYAVERAFIALVAQEGLDGQPDDALAVDALDAIADAFTDEGRAVGTARIVPVLVHGSTLATSHCANIARQALLACGLPSRPVDGDAGTVDAYAADLDVRTANAHKRLSQDS